MKPILFSLGPIHIYSFGLLIVLGVFTSLWLMSKKTSDHPFSHKDQIFDLVFVTVASGFLGGRLAYVIQFRDWYMENPLKILTLWEGGLIYYGGVIGAILGLMIFSRIKGYRLTEVLDFLLPYVALTQAFGRVGCFLNGCCGGKVCELPWAVQGDQPGEQVHPAQIYEAIFTVLLFLFLKRTYSQKNKWGR